MDAFWFIQKFEYSSFFTQNLSVVVDAFFTQTFELKLRKLFMQCINLQFGKFLTKGNSYCSGESIALELVLREPFRML